MRLIPSVFVNCFLDGERGYDGFLRHLSPENLESSLYRRLLEVSSFLSIFFLFVYTPESALAGVGPCIVPWTPMYGPTAAGCTRSTSHVSPFSVLEMSRNVGEKLGCTPSHDARES